MRPAEVTVRAPGKVNLYLAVGSLDDDGFHDVRTVLQAVSLYDELTASPADAGTVALTIEGEGAKTLSADEGNLAVRAARLLAASAEVTDGVQMVLRKSIPVAAGMAGGSADAAAALVACDALWGTELSRQQLESLAAELGSDVPFSLVGGTALGTGRGDVLSPVLSRGTYHWVFAIADGELSTPAVYAELDRYREELPRPALWSHSDTLAAVSRGDPEALASTLAERPAGARDPASPGAAPRAGRGDGARRPGRPGQRFRADLRLPDGRRRGGGAARGGTRRSRRLPVGALRPRPGAGSAGDLVSGVRR